MTDKSSSSSRRQQDTAIDKEDDTIDLTTLTQGPPSATCQINEISSDEDQNSEDEESDENEVIRKLYCHLYL